MPTSESLKTSSLAVIAGGGREMGGRWEAWESADCATCFHGSKVILRFLLLAEGPPHCPSLVSWGFFLPY